MPCLDRGGDPVISGFGLDVGCYAALDRGLFGGWVFLLWVCHFYHRCNVDAGYGYVEGLGGKCLVI